MKVKKRILVFAILLGMLTVALLYTYIQGLGNEKVVQADLRNVVVSANTIPAHVKITAEMLTIKTMSVEAVHPESVTNIDDLVGGTTKVEIISGEQVLVSRIITDNVSSPLAYRIPENMRAMAIPMNEISGVAGYIMPGDKVDILVRYNDEKISPTQFVVTQFQNIEVLEKGPYVTIAEEKQMGLSSSLTLLVSPAQAEVLAFANLNGTIQLTLRNPVDTTKVDLQQFDTGNFNTWRDR